MSTHAWFRKLLFALIMSQSFSRAPAANLEASVNLSSASLTTTQLPPILNGTVQIYFQRESINELIRGSNTTVYFNCSVREYNEDDSRERDRDFPRINSTTFFARITTGNADIVQFILPPDMVGREPHKENIFDLHLTHQLKIPLRINGVNNFTIQAMQIGYVTVFVTIFGTGSYVMARSSQVNQNLAQGDMKVTVVPRQKVADFVFDCSAAAVAILISFGIGCVTDTENLKRQLKYPVSLVIGFCCQFLLMPVVSMGVR